MTQESTQNTDLQAWWSSLDFAHKNQYDLNEKNEIVLKPHAGFKETIIGEVPQDQPDIYIKLLQDKYTEVSGKLDELKQEWEKEDDKLNLYGKVERLKEYLKHAAAIGDFHQLYDEVVSMDKVLGGLIEENYTKKVALAEKAESLSEAEDFKQTTEEYKQLIEDWKAIGYVDKKRSDDLWSRIEQARDKFYERKQEHHEDVKMEMMQNLDLKMEVVDKAEQLAGSEDWKETTQQLKDLMEKWKGIGHTMHDKNEELWQRFQAANNTFFEKKRAHFEVIEKEQEANYEAKEKLVAQAEEIKDSEDWGETSKKYTELMDEWKKIGRVSRDKSDEIWSRFNAARDHFFGRKREHTQAFKLTLEDNYAQKLALLKRAEDLQESTQWREATEEINELMTEWKKIGPVPRKHSDEIWERFIGARKKFFARKDANREKRKKQYEQRSKQRVQQTGSFIQKLEEELKEEEEKLVDFNEGLKNITPGLKEEELREHLTKLIAETEKKIEHKKEKLTDASKQLEELEAKEKAKEEEKEQKEEQ